MGRHDGELPWDPFRLLATFRFDNNTRSRLPPLPAAVFLTYNNPSERLAAVPLQNRACGIFSNQCKSDVFGSAITD